MLRRLFLLLLWVLWSCLTIVTLAAPYPKQWHQMDNDRLFKMAKEFKTRQQMDSAMACYSIVANRLKAKGDIESKKQSVYAYCRLGNLYQYEYYNYQKSADCLLLAQREAEELGDSTLLADIYHELGCLYLQYESSHEGSDLSQSMSHFRQACRYVSHDSSVGDVYMFNFVSTGMQFNHVDEIITESHVYCDRHRQPNYVTHLCHAAWAVKDGNNAEAVEWLNRSLAVVEEVDDAYHARLAAILLIIKCALLDKMGQDSESLDVLSKYERIVRKYDFKEGVPDYYNQLYRFYSRRGNNALANAYRLKFFEAVDTLTGLTQLSYLTKAPLVFDLQQAAEDAHNQEMRRQRLTQTLWLVTVAALVFLALLVMLYRRNRQLKERNQALYEQSLEQLAIIDEARRAAPPVQQPLPSSEVIDQPTAEPEATSTDVDDEVLQDIYQRVKAVMESSPAIFEESFSLAKLHELVGSNTKYISRAISQYAHADFKSLLSQYRIREACRRINDIEHYGQYTIEAIAKSVGVTSRTSFVQNFKKQTGLTPSAYIKLAHEKSTTAQ